MKSGQPFKKFHRYITFKKDDNELLFFLLQNMVRDLTSFYHMRYGKDPETIEISIQDFETRVMQLHVKSSRCKKGSRIEYQRVLQFLSI